MATPTLPDDDDHPDGAPAAPTAATTPTANDATPEPEIGYRWGTLPKPERRDALDARLTEWAVMPNHGDLLGPFDSHGRGGWTLGGGGPLTLTGADVYYLALRSVVGLSGDIANVFAQLRGRPILAPSAILDLGCANLLGAHLEHADLSGADLKHADLSVAHLEHANLLGAHLEHANLLGLAHLEHANLRSATFDGDTNLDSVSFGAARWWERFVPWSKPTTTALGDIHWGGVGAVDLTQIAGGWDGVQRLGDERRVRWRASAGRRASVVRAYRQVAAQLRAQGLNEPADRFTYRAYVLNRGVLLRRTLRNPLRLPAYLGSWLLALLAGYGFRPGRTILCYLATIAFFAYAYVQVTHGLPLVPPLGPLAPDGLLRFGTSASIPPLPPNEALILSVSSFHGRGFFQPLKSLGDPVAGLAAVEAIIGLLIEVSFIATFTQRFFGK